MNGLFQNYECCSFSHLLSSKQDSERHFFGSSSQVALMNINLLLSLLFLGGNFFFKSIIKTNEINKNKVQTKIAVSIRKENK